jgi:hypothetical protein
MICQKLVRLFVDDCLLYRPIRCHQDHVDLQDLNLEKWVDTWCMRYKATTCYILSVKKSPIYCNKLGNSILEEVENNPYLGLSISNDLKWTNHIYNICKKVSSTLGLIRRNFDIVQLNVVERLCLTNKIYTLEYGAVIWDSFSQSDIDKIETNSTKAARFISEDCKSLDRGCVT